MLFSLWDVLGKRVDGKRVTREKYTESIYTKTGEETERNNIVKERVGQLVV